jgi:hypothetical protein
MKSPKSPHFGRMAGGLALTLALLSSATTARAYVYASDIKINGSLTGVGVGTNSPLSITYHLNQTADQGVTVTILNGTTTVATVPGGTNMGLNAVSWTPTVLGTYTVQISASATGFTNWTQISPDSTNNVAVFAHGLAVDANTNSPYFGRIFVNCALNATQHGVKQMVGVYKYNADGTPADEGSFGYGGYTVDNSGNVDTGNAGYTVPEMAIHGSSGAAERGMRVGTDDRLYMNDYSDDGSVVAFDILVSTNQMVIDQGPSSGNYPAAPNYSGLMLSPYSYGFDNGVDCFDVLPTAGGNSSVFLGDDDLPGLGVWNFHMLNGASDPADDVGSCAVYAGSGVSLLISSGGIMVDTNLDIFVSADRVNAGDTSARTMVYSNWNNGTIPAEGSGTAYWLPTASWAVGSADDTMSGIYDTVIDSRTNPKYVAVTMHQGAPESYGYSGDNGGIRVLNAVDGSVVSVTNGSSIQTLTNIDCGNWYEGASFDGVGNLYASSTTTNYWRVWSPPGANTYVTTAVPQIIVLVPPAISSVSAVPATSGYVTVTLAFTASGNPALSALSVLGSANVRGAYTTVSGAAITGSAGAYQATFLAPSGTTQYYMIQEK